MVFPDQLSENLDEIYVAQEERKQKFPPRVRQIFIAIAVSILSFPDGFDNFLVSNEAVEIEKVELISSVHPFIGWLIGLLEDDAQKDETVKGTLRYVTYEISCWIVEKMGRKCGLLIVATLRFVAWVFIYFGEEDSPALSLGTFINDICTDGVTVTAYVYLTEIADPKIRGLLCAIFVLSASLGQFLIMVLCHIFSSGIILSMIITSAVGFLAVLFCPESPVYLLHKDHEKGAEKTFHCVRGDGEDARTEFQEMVAMEPKTKRGSGCWLIRYFRRICSKESVKPALVIMMLVSVQTLSGSRRTMEIYPKSFSNSFMQKHQDSHDKYGEVATTLKLVSSALSLYFVQKFSRISLLTASCLASSFMWSLKYSFEILTRQPTLLKTSHIMAVMEFPVYIITWIGLGFLPLVIFAELSPGSRRAHGFSSAGANQLTWIFLGFLILLSVEPVELNLFFGLSSLVAAAFVWLFSPETAGKSLCQIEKDFIRNRKQDESK